MTQDVPREVLPGICRSQGTAPGASGYLLKVIPGVSRLSCCFLPLRHHRQTKAGDLGSGMQRNKGWRALGQGAGDLGQLWAGWAPLAPGDVHDSCCWAWLLGSAWTEEIFRAEACRGRSWISWSHWVRAQLGISTTPLSLSHGPSRGPLARQVFIHHSLLP